MIGRTIGPYEVTAKLGEGGMGQVYRARDTKLGRDVAIKTLPPAFVADTERVTRFEREARTLAALNHTNIAQIHGLVDVDGGSALVMEFVDGEDLSAAISRGRVPVTEALKIARQVAAALETAHEAGIIHRDLKPANIKVRPDGMVKVLDFGLAKAFGPSGGSTDGSRPRDAISASIANSPTLTRPATELGMILGTAAYMAPEQARGKPVDRRADVWAFGVILYEMLMGRRAFDGPEISDVLASVLKDTLPLDALPPDTPASIRQLLKRCLHKDRAERLDSMSVARLEIADALAADGGEAGMAGPAAVVSGRRSMWPSAVVALIVGAAAWWAGSATSRSAANHDSRVVSFDVALSGDLNAVAITPAGDTLIFQTDRLYMRGLSDAAVRPIPGTEGARNLAVSGDGRWALFNVPGALRKVALAGGDPLTLAEVDYDSPGSGWGPDNTVLFTPGWNAALYSVSADGGGKPRAVSTIDGANGELSHWWPQLLPDQKSVLFTIWTAAAGINDARIGVLDPATGRHRVIGPGAFARYIRSGHLIYFHAGRYHAVKFDPGQMRIVGDPVSVLTDVMAHDPLGNRQKPWAVSDDGTLVSVVGPLMPQWHLSWIGTDGAITPVPQLTVAHHVLDITADGRWVASSRIEGGVYSIWLTDLSRGTQDKLNLTGSSFSPSWSPDGRFFIYTSMRKGHFDMWQYRMDEGRAQELIGEPLDQNATAVSSDGNFVILEDTSADGTVRTTYARVDAPGKRIPIEGLVPPEEVRFSPDDRWIAADISVAGKRQIVVRPFPSGGAAVNITPRGGSRPVWPRTGQRILYSRGNEILAVPYSVVGGRFTVAAEQVVVRLPYPGELFGVSSDGRFLVGTIAAGQERQARVVLNWFQQLPK
jgi:hypothetical protein